MRLTLLTSHHSRSASFETHPPIPTPTISLLQTIPTITMYYLQRVMYLLLYTQHTLHMATAGFQQSSEIYTICYPGFSTLPS